MVFRTRVIVRLGTQNRMVTKGYRKGVYDRVTTGTAANWKVIRAARLGAEVLQHSECRDVARYVSAADKLTISYQDMATR
jgi:hypothetical protein